MSTQISGEFEKRTLCNRGNLEANCDRENHDPQNLSDTNGAAKSVRGLVPDGFISYKSILIVGNPGSI
jgi:hypothetical protein